MARFQLFLILLLSVLLVQSCAEIVPLTGGEKDLSAPAVKNQYPPQGTTNFKGNSIEVTFDEYVKINDPNSTISINPSGTKINSELKNKTLILSWDGNLKESTTYIIQLNGTVRDINESNDSIMQFVFSTGPFIDSLSYSGKAIGAFSNSTQSNLTIGLYPADSNPLQTKPVYATRTTSTGDFEFSYLKPGSYRLFAFQDSNKDQKVQPDESIGFVNEPVSPGDTVPARIRVFSRKAPHDALKATFVPPGIAVIHNLDSIDVSRLTINGEQAELFQTYSHDSIAVALPPNTGSNYLFAYDTVRFSKPLTVAERSVPLLIRQESKSGKWRSGDSLTFSINDRIAIADTTLINITTEKGAYVGYSIFQQQNRITLIPDPRTTDHFTVEFGKGAVSGRTGKSDTIRFKYNSLLSADLSTLKLNCADLEGQWIVQLTQNDRVLYSAIKPAGDTSVVFKGIEPGMYNARCIADENRNGTWDTGDFEAGKQPEEIRRYTLTQKLRPNWDVEETLEREP